MTFSYFPSLRVLFRILVALLGTCSAQILHAESLGIPDLKIDQNGSFLFDGVPFSVVHYDENWKGTTQVLLASEEGFPKSTHQTWETRGKFPIPPTAFTLLEEIRAEGKWDFHTKYQATGLPAEGEPNLALVVTLPIPNFKGQKITVDGESVTLPPDYQDGKLFTKKATKLTIPTWRGVLDVEGLFYMHVQDTRQWKGEDYRIRIFFTRSEEKNSAKLEVKFRFRPYGSSPLSLVERANRSLADARANDGIGGWSDQGPENDLSILGGGPLLAAGVFFKLVSTGGSSENSILALAGNDSKNLPDSVNLPLNGKPAFANLYLLHATAFTPSPAGEVGKLEVVYGDGTRTTFDISSSRDVGDWWSATPLENGSIGWSGENKSSPICLFVSRFPTDLKPIQEVIFHSARKAMWLIAGLSGSSDPILVGNNARKPFQVKASKEWVPFDYALSILPGSVFDFSALTDSPAGKHGPIQVSSSGGFEFKEQPGKPVRFWGVNLCFSANYLAKADCDRVAELLWRSGYNSVRLHHYDAELLKKGATSSSEFDPNKLEQLDYLFAALKARGLYINIDLYSTRKFPASEIPELGGEVGREIKELAPISEAAWNALAQFTKNLLTHKNPYTGLTWGNDPALIGICPVNEDSRLEFPTASKAELRKLYDLRFQEWLAKHPEESADTISSQQRFLVEIRGNFDTRMRNYIRSLGVTALVTGSNYKTSQALGFLRAGYDYVDNHMYWDHPEFPDSDWALPIQFRQISSTRFAARVPRDLMPTRILGKPFVVTEFNFVCPNQYRSEGSLLMPAYASLQGWDALYNFDFATTASQLTGPKRAGTFDIAVDPIGLLGDRLSALMFRRGDVKTADRTIAFGLEPDYAFDKNLNRPAEFPSSFSLLGLITKIGSVTNFTEKKWDALVLSGRSPGIASYASSPNLLHELEQAGLLPQNPNTAGEVYRSETGELELHQNEGLFKLVTPRVEGFVLPAGKTARGNLVSVENGSTFGTVSVASVSNAALAESHRLLVLHLTDALNDKIQFADERRRLLTNLGSLPHLVRSGTAKIFLRLPTGPDFRWTVWQVSPSGERLMEQPSTQNPEGLEFLSDTSAGVLAYEVVSQSSLTSKLP